MGDEAAFSGKGFGLDRVKDTLAEATELKIINKEQSERLAELLLSRGFENPEGKEVSDRQAAATEDTATVGLEESELPRFVRGFHDVLITIGVITAALGLSFTIGAWSVVLAAWLLSEIFVRRQRLALPAFSLTVIYASAIIPVFDDLVRPFLDGWMATYWRVGATLAIPLGLFLYYLRFRVPVSLAGAILTTFMFLWVAGISAFYFDVSPDYLYLRLPWFFTCLSFVLSMALFCAALWFDWRDLERRSVRSDVAFWLHMAAAPALLYATTLLLMGLFGAQTTSFNFLNSLATFALPVVVVLMVVGVIIDRRAFVTAGLVSLGSAAAYFLQDFDYRESDAIGFAFLMVGGVVLLIGTNWRGLRGIALAALPSRWRVVFRPV